MKRTLATLAVALAATVLPATPADAGGCGSDGVCVSVYHRQDSGWDAPIVVMCGGRAYAVAEYAWDPCVDVEQVYTPRGMELWGWSSSGGWYRFRDATGWSDSGNLSVRRLTVTRD